jgi:hypothetical protein
MVPREWPGDRCYIVCGGESIRAQRKLIPRLPGRVIAIKQSVVLKPDADVLFLSGERTAEIAAPLLPKFRGTHIIVRGKSCPELPDTVKRVTRSKDHTRLCDLPDHVCGYDAGTSAINLAFHFGATEIVMLGYDMCGGRWFAGEIKHHMPRPPEAHFQRHMVPLPELAKDCQRRGIRVVNVSPISRVTAFERGRLEDWL